MRHQLVQWLCIFCTIFIVVVKAQAETNECESLLETSRWWLAPHGQRLITGLLVESKDNHIILAVTDYYGGSHEQMYHQIQQNFDIKRSLWAGEMLIENPQSQTAHGILMLSINTSGYIWKKTKAPLSLDVNDPGVLKESLEKYRPNLVAPTTQYFIYSNDRPHLDPLFIDLHKRVRENESETVRHQFRNILSTIVNLSSYLNKQSSLTNEDKLAILTKMSPKSIDDLIFFFETFLRYSGSKLANQMQIEQEIFQKMRESSEKTRDEYLLLANLVKEIKFHSKWDDKDVEIIVLDSD